MITAAALAYDRLVANLNMSDSERMAILKSVPPAQLRIIGGWWPALSKFCANRIAPEHSQRPVNGLNVEVGCPDARCLFRDPDGRGLRWYLSGGSVLSYGRCEQAHCYFCEEEKVEAAQAGGEG